MDLYNTLGFGPYQLDLSTSENLGWRSLPFHQPKEELRDIAYGLVPSATQPHSRLDVLSYQWAFRHVDVNIINQPGYRFDGRTTFPAILNQGSDEIKLQACALEPQKDNLGHHLRFAQMFAHAACLLEKFKIFVLLNARLSLNQQHDLHKLRIVQNAVLCKGNSANNQDDQCVPRWFSLREPVEGIPQYLTSDCQFAPQHRANGDLASLASLLACFTHWSYEYHQREGLICGFRGSNGVITDLTFEDNQRPWFLGSPSTAGLQLFTATHICDSMWCNSVGLTQPPPYYPME